MNRPLAAISWSGGKDSCLALMRAWPDFDVRVMVTMFDEGGERSRSHGLRPGVIEAQAQRLGLTTVSERCAWATYEEAFGRAMTEVARLGCEHIVFGDIFEDDHRRWTERLAAGAGLTAHQPLWGEATGDLVREFLRRGGRASIVTVREACLDETWLGRPLTVDAIDAMTALGADPCGERGEYHTVVTDCPLFSAPLQLATGIRVSHGGCFAIDLQLADLGLAPHASPALG
jgi:uncharacterized protein (TIGR00290 family)